jgi:hypothetical protein
MNLQNWVEQARAHWKEFRPNLYRDLKASGQLEAKLQEAAERTFQEMGELRQMGYSEQESWEVVRQSYLFPPEDGANPPHDSPFWKPTSTPLTDLIHDAIKSGAREVDIPSPSMTLRDLTNALKGK